MTGEFSLGHFDSSIPNRPGSRQRLASWVSLVVSLIVLGIKTFAYTKTHSTAVLSDALETIVNVIAAFVAIFVIRYGASPADEEHPYGHGKVEYFSAAFEGGLIFFASLLILYQGAMAFIKGGPLHELEAGMVYIFIASLFNLFLALYLRKISREDKSEALAASSSHVMSDVVTTGGIFLGLLLVYLTGWEWIDPLLAVGVAVHLGWEGWKIVRRSIAGLIDEVDIESLRNLCDSFEKNRRPGVIDIHNLKTIRAGSFHHIDAHLVVPEFWDIRTAHEVTQKFEDDVVRSYVFDGEIAFHLDPCESKYCQVCQVEPCPIRVSPLKKLVPFKAEDLVRGPKLDSQV